MKKKFKLFAALFIMSMTFTALFSISASALTDGDWEFQLLDDEVMITKYTGSDSDVVIPDKIFGATVTRVKERTFQQSGIVKITFPGTVREIESLAYNPTQNSIQEIVLSEGTEIINGSAFSNCHVLTSVLIPSTIKEIGKNAFYGCESLKQISLPQGLEKLGNGAFQYSGLVSVEIPDSVTDLGGGLFYKCKSLISVKLPNSTEILDNYWPGGMFEGCSSLPSISLPVSLKKIGYDAFNGCTSFKNIILPTSLREIDSDAFNGCTGITEVTIPYGVTTIQDAFSNCENLKAIYIPDTLKSMSPYILYNSPNAIIYCSADSYAADFCKKNNISYLTDKSVNSLITVYYNGTRISFHTYDQDPALIDDRTLMPLRAVFETMNATVDWDQATQTVTSTRDGITVKITIGDDKIYKNGQAIATDVPAQLINDRTMVPVRVIAEAFGADVQWNGGARSVFINE